MGSKRKTQPTTWETVREIAITLPGVVEGKSYGAPAFHVSAGNAIDLAAQLCWQQAAEDHAPDGCQAGSNLSAHVI